MPYRRLPNTDNARIRALKTAIEKNAPFNGANVISLEIWSLEIMLRNFENAQMSYQESLTTQANSNRKFQKLVKNARLYISHFIQVLNMCVVRKEIKKEMKLLYNLDPDSFAVPDLTSNDSIIYWGENVMKGEQTRLNQGGIPIYNPTIGRVNVAFSQFKDAYFGQKTYQNTTARQLETLSQQRERIDKALLTIWNETEAAFADLPPNERLEKCKEYGVVYYLRKGEKEKLESENN